MRKYRFLLLFVFFSTIVISCSKDANEPETPKAVVKSGNLKAAGASANDILSNDNFNKLIIEVAYVTGFKPTQQAIDDFVDFLKARTFKQDIEVLYKEVASSGETSFTIQKIADIESAIRTIYNDGETLAIYIYFADAPDEGDDDEEGLVTLGAVYRNTSMVIYESTIIDLAKKSAQISNAAVESATLQHEFAHLFGLVNLGTTMVNPHEDSEAANHCNVQGCLMRAELQFGSGMKKMLVAKNSAIPSLDPACLADLQANGGR